jgi:hypothetical protein
MSRKVVFMGFVLHVDPDMKTAERNEVIKPLPLQHIMTKPAWNGYKSSHKIVDVDDDTVVPSDYR